LFADGKQIAQFSYNGRSKTINELNAISSSLSA
jgi:hypothetical protein